MLTSPDRLHGEKQLEQRTLEASSNTYDKQLVSRIGGPNGGLGTPNRTSISYGTVSSVQETAQLAHAEAERRSAQQLRPLSMPERHGRQTSLDSPASSRWPSSGAVSPGFTGSRPWWPEHGPPPDHSRTLSQSGLSVQNHNHPHPHPHPPTRHGSLTFDDSISQRGSYDQSIFAHDDMMEDGPMSNLRLHDRSPGSSVDLQLNARAGTKRRASSPPRDAGEERSSVSSMSGHSEIYHRRSIQQLPSRGSPVSRFHPNHSSLSSASSFGPRQNSLGSSLGVSSIPSSATSYGSGGRLSPSALSPAFDPNSDVRMASAKTLDPNLASANQHQRTHSQSTQGGVQRTPTGSASHSRTNSVSQLQSVYICECCPKKPKKFDTEEELR